MEDQIWLSMKSVFVWHWTNSKLLIFKIKFICSGNNARRIWCFISADNGTVHHKYGCLNFKSDSSNVCEALNPFVDDPKIFIVERVISILTMCCSLLLKRIQTVASARTPVNGALSIIFEYTRTHFYHKCNHKVQRFNDNNRIRLGGENEQMRMPAKVEVARNITNREREIENPGRNCWISRWNEQTYRWNRLNSCIKWKSSIEKRWYAEQWITYYTHT